MLQSAVWLMLDALWAEQAAVVLGCCGRWRSLGEPGCTAVFVKAGHVEGAGRAWTGWAWALLSCAGQCGHEHAPLPFQLCAISGMLTLLIMYACCPAKTLQGGAERGADCSRDRGAGSSSCCQGLCSIRCGGLLRLPSAKVGRAGVAQRPASSEAMCSHQPSPVVCTHSTSPRAHTQRPPASLISLPQVRLRLEAAGILIMDTPEGTTWKPGPRLHIAEEENAAAAAPAAV